MSFQRAERFTGASELVLLSVKPLQRRLLNHSMAPVSREVHSYTHGRYCLR